MITNKEIQAIKLSPTKRDFYQIYSELLDLAGKISERWDPTSCNESDPGAVLLKVATGLADKLNYTIDKNILEAFMPSAAQTDSMRKLCEMMGYNIKYYQSAETNLTVTYNNFEKDDVGFILTRGTTFTNIDGDLVYTMADPETDYIEFTPAFKTRTIKVIQGALVECTTNNDNLVTIDLLDDNQRYYLPESQIAENGIFVYRDTDKFVKVDNLNTQSYNTRCFKFGFDSAKNRPYLQFPEDINNLIGNGLNISYIRTDGINGNVSRGMITKIKDFVLKNDTADQLSEEDFTVINNEAATNGRNIETIRQAYRNFKKTIGTFDTLVTCRDYMNAIYNLTDEKGNDLVSNVLVTDIRTDLNNAIEICTYNNFGVSYIPVSLKNGSNTEDLIDHFDLLVYPFKAMNGLDTKAYKDSFKFDTTCFEDIISEIDENKTLAHTIRHPNPNAPDEIACIKNCLRLNAKINTKFKVSAAEEKLILLSIKNALCSRFNMRELEFGEEIPFDDILDCIENADERIKSVSLEEPELYTMASMVNGDNELVAGTPDNNTQVFNSDLHNKLVLRNVLAGRVPLFEYDNTFAPDYLEKNLTGDELVNASSATSLPKDEATSTPKRYISDIKSSWTPTITNGLELKENQIVKFSAPNYRTTVTYPAYVNYSFKKNDTTAQTQMAALPTLINSFSSWNDALQYIQNSPDREIYRQLPASSSRKQGYLVDNDLHKYVITEITETNFNEQYYYFETDEAKGQDANYPYIEKDSEYTLDEGEELTVEYTPSSTNDETQKPIIKVYTAGQIIKPNFNLKDTNSEITNGKSKTKTITYQNEEINVFSLGAQEQIEIREIAEVDLLDPKNEGNTTPRVIELGLIAKNYSDLSDNPTDKYYTLKEDEYLFFTDPDKTELAYYGSGSRIYLSDAIKTKIRDSKAILSQNSIESIMNNGISALSSVRIALNSKYTDQLTINDRAIKVQERQYKTAAKGCKLIVEGSDNIIGWTDKDDKDYLLPTVTTSWEHECLLLLDVGPDKAQELHENETITLSYKAAEEEEWSGTEADVNITYAAGYNGEPVYLKTSQYIQSSGNDIDIMSGYLYEVDENNKRLNDYDFSIKAIKLANPVQLRDSFLEFENILDGFTKIPVKEIPSGGITLNVNLPADHYGLIAFVYNGQEESRKITLTSGANTLEFFNAKTSYADAASTQINLNEGLNIIKIKASGSITITTDDKNANLLFSRLSVVKGINNKVLCYKQVGTNNDTAEDELLAAIGKIEEDIGIKFFYNCPMNKNKELNLNYALITDQSATNTLSDPRAYYDPNNINNRFVISEIDIDYVNKGITVAKSSKL